MGIERCMYITIIAVAPLRLLPGPNAPHPFRPRGLRPKISKLLWFAYPANPLALVTS